MVQSLGVLAWCSIPVVMVAGIGPVLNGELVFDFFSSDFNAPFISCQVRNNNLVDLTSYKNLTISKRQITSIFKEPEETGSMKPLQTATHEINFDSVDFSYVPGEDGAETRHLYGARPEAHGHCRGTPVPANLPF